MKHTVILLCLIFCSCKINAQSLSFEIVGIRQNKGDILVSVFNKSDGFPFETQKAVKLLKGKSDKSQISFSIDQLPGGRYAIACFQDTNGDGILNQNLLGIPKEGYGVSNNAFNTFSAPSFEASSFLHDKNTLIRFRMKY